MLKAIEGYFVELKKKWNEKKATEISAKTKELLVSKTKKLS